MAGLLISLLLLLTFEQPGPAAPVPPVGANRYGLAVVQNIGTYRALARNDHDRYLVDLSQFVPGLRLKLAYACEDNVTGRILYDVGRAYATLEAAEELSAAQRELSAQGLGLRVWDAYRPYAATLALWDVVRDRRFAASPSSGSLHNLGSALDVTLVRADGRALEMPTRYDALGPQAAHGYQDLPAAVKARRSLLRRTLARRGLQTLPEEWWHYQRLAFGLPLPLDIAIGSLTAVALPVDVWLRFPPAGRLAVVAERWRFLAAVQ